MDQKLDNSSFQNDAPDTWHALMVELQMEVENIPADQLLEPLGDPPQDAVLIKAKIDPSLKKLFTYMRRLNLQALHADVDAEYGLTAEVREVAKTASAELWPRIHAAQALFYATLRLENDIPVHCELSIYCGYRICCR